MDIHHLILYLAPKRHFVVSINHPHHLAYRWYRWDWSPGPLTNAPCSLLHTHHLQDGRTGMPQVWHIKGAPSARLQGVLEMCLKTGEISMCPKPSQTAPWHFLSFLPKITKWLCNLTWGFWKIFLLAWPSMQSDKQFHFRLALKLARGPFEMFLSVCTASKSTRVKVCSSELQKHVKYGGKGLKFHVSIPQSPERQGAREVAKR